MMALIPDDEGGAIMKSRHPYLVLLMLLVAAMACTFAEVIDVATETSESALHPPTATFSVPPPTVASPPTVPIPTSPPTASVPSPTPRAPLIVPLADPVALEVLQRLNEWRLQAGVWPLLHNPTLTEAAVDQAAYLTTLSAIPSGEAVHIDASGGNIEERTSALGWPDYGNALRIAVTEIVAVGTVDFAIDFWQGSEIHNRAATSPSFREIGIAAAPHLGQTVIVAVLGSRPNELTVLSRQGADALYLSSERYRFAMNSLFIEDIEQYQFLPTPDSTPNPEAWLPWELVAHIPAGLTAPYHLALDDGLRTTNVTVNLSSDEAWLPDTLEAVAGASVEMMPSAPLPPSAADFAPEVALIYNEESFTIENLSGEPLDIEYLVFSADDMRELAVTAWDTEFMTAPLQFFPPGECLQAKPYDIGIVPAVDCRVIRGIINIPRENVFWPDRDFFVYFEDTFVASCAAATERCVFTVPDREE